VTSPDAPFAGALPGLAPELLDQAKALIARARGVVLGAGHGVHRSRHLGGGAEFSEFKAYTPGDDLRHVDWKVHGRTDKYVVRQYESDRQTAVHLLLDRSGSMAFGTTAGGAPSRAGVPAPTSKWDAARTLALALMFVFLRQGDRVGAIVADGSGRQLVPVRGGQRQALELARQAVVAEPSGDGDLPAALEELAIRGRRSVVVVVSDLLTEQDDGLDALAVHRARGREAWVVHVVDPAEISFPYDEPIRFVGLEGGGELSLNPRELARIYREEFAAHLARQERRCTDHGIRYLRLVTDQPLDEALARFVGERSWG